MSYNDFASVYDKLTFNVEYKKRAEYINSLLSSVGVNGGILLDLACGTGALSKELASYGYDMILVDLSPEMLMIAKERIPNALVLCQNMTELDLFGTVNAAVCSLDSINHLLKPCDVKKVFENVALFLEKGGAFVFDVNTIYKHQNILANNTFVYEQDDIYCVWQNSLHKKNNIVDINLDIFTKQNGLYSRTTESFSERAYSSDEIKNWLTQSGFDVVGVYDDMTTQLQNDCSQRVYFSAIKKG